MKQLTLIKVAGVVVSMAAFGGGMAHADPVVEHTADYTEVNEHGTSTGVTHDDAEFDSLAGAFEKVEGSDKITVDDIELAQQDDLDKLQTQVDNLDTGSSYDDTAITQATAAAQSTADTADTKAEGAATAAINALGAANDAQTDADAAQATANTAKSTADGNATHLGTLGDKVDANTDAINTKQDQLTQDQLDSFTADSDTQLTEDQVDAFVSNNGYLTDADLAYTTDTTLTEAQVDAYADNNGYAQDSDVKSNDTDISLNSSAIYNTNVAVSSNADDIDALEASALSIDSDGVVTEGTDTATELSAAWGSSNSQVTVTVEETADGEWTVAGYYDDSGEFAGSDNGGPIFATQAEAEARLAELAAYGRNTQ